MFTLQAIDDLLLWHEMFRSLIKHFFNYILYFRINVGDSLGDFIFKLLLDFL